MDARNTRRDLTLDELRGIIDALADAGCQHMVISGGEPFLRDDLSAIVAYVRERGIASVDVLTNGTAVTPEKLAAIAPYVGRVSVSFDGPNAEEAPVIRREPLFERLVAAVEMIREAGIQPHIIPTAHGGNIDVLGEYVALADSLGATMNFSLLSAPAESDELAAVIPDDAALERLAQATLALSRNGVPVLADTPVSTNLSTTCGCGAGCAMVSVSADGEVFPCHMMHDAVFSLGSLVEDPECLERAPRPRPACGRFGRLRRLRHPLPLRWRLPRPCPLRHRRRRGPRPLLRPHADVLPSAFRGHASSQLKKGGGVCCSIATWTRRAFVGLLAPQEIPV